MGAAFSAWLAATCTPVPSAPPQVAIEIEVEQGLETEVESRAEPPPPPPQPPQPPPTTPTPPTPPSPPGLVSKPPLSPQVKHVVARKAAVPTLSEFTILAFVDLVRSGVLEQSGPLRDYSEDQCKLYAQPEQDPLGSLTATLWFLRCHKIADLSWKSRQCAAVVLTSFHKIATSQTSRRKLRALTVERIVRRFLLSDEEERVQNLDELVQTHPRLEAHLAWHNDLLYFWQTSPMAAVEERLWVLLRDNVLREDAVIAIRGISFFFIVNALLDGNFDKNFDAYSPIEFGGGVVGLSILCGRRAWHDIDHTADVTGVYREVAIKALKASRRTPAMRVASYRDCTSKRSVARCVTTKILDAVAASLAH